MALALLTHRHAPELEVAACAYHEEKLARDAALRPDRLSAIEHGWGIDYAIEVARLRRGEGNIHPRFGVLLLREGIGATVEHHALPLAQTVESSDLVLAVNGEIADELRTRFPRRNIQTVFGYLGEGGRVKENKNYFLPFVRYQLWADSRQLKKLDALAQRVADKVRRAV